MKTLPALVLALSTTLNAADCDKLAIMVGIGKLDDKETTYFASQEYEEVIQYDYSQVLVLRDSDRDGKIDRECRYSIYESKCNNRKDESHFEKFDKILAYCRDEAKKVTCIPDKKI